METLKKYKKEILACTVAAGLGLYFWNSSAKSDNKDQNNTDNSTPSGIIVKIVGGIYSKETIYSVSEAINSKSIEKTKGIVQNGRKKRRNFMKYFEKYSDIVAQTMEKRDRIVEKIRKNIFDTHNIDLNIWDKSMEHYYMSMDEEFSKKMQDITSDMYRKHMRFYFLRNDVEFKEISNELLVEIINFMTTTVNKEDNKILEEIVMLSEYDPNAGVEILEARVYDKVAEKFQVEEEDIQQALRDTPESSGVHILFRNFHDTLIEAAAGYDENEEIDLRDPYPDVGGDDLENEGDHFDELKEGEEGQDNEDDYEDVED